MDATVTISSQVSRPSAFSLFTNSKPTKPKLFPGENVPKPSVFASCQAVSFPETYFSIRSCGNQRGRPFRKNDAASSSMLNGDENRVPKSSGAKPSTQKDLIDLFKRIRDSISKGESGRTKTEKSALTKDNSLVESVSGLLQSRREMTASTSNERSRIRKSECKIPNDQPPPDFKLIRPPSNFVKKSPIPSPTASRKEDFVLGTAELKHATNLAIEKMKLTELKELAKARGIKGYSKLKKSELINLLRSQGDV
ncbi:hypothetical protein Ancab_033958 [Ancistrocladus abbreviatus]